jgi:hypothetical protein
MIISIMAKANPGVKRRRTFTLSPGSITYLEQETRRRNVDSVSAVLDELLLEKTQEQQRAALEANIKSYYDSLTDDEVEEQRSWGQFAEQHLVLTEEELSHAQSTAGRNLVHETPHRPSGKRKAPRSHRLNQRTKQSSAR